MITCIIIVGLAFIWLGYETNWLTIRLPKGKSVAVETSCPNWNEPVLVCPKCGKPAFALMAKFIEAGNSKCKVNPLCQDCLAKLETQIIKSQKPCKPVLFHHIPDNSYGYDFSDNATMEILVNGKVIASINGNYKRGMIKQLMLQY